MGLFRQDQSLHERIGELQAKVEGLRAELDAALHETRQTLEVMAREMDNFRLDYQGLYEKARVQLTKLARRDREATDGEPAEPDLSRYRQMLAEKRLRS